MSFKYQLEASAPQQFEGGTSRTVTRQNISSLKDLAIYSLQINPGCLRELHWHPNAGELSYCLQGQGTMGVFSPAGDHATFEIGVGSVSFVPTGYFHYIRNTGSETLRVIAGFTHEVPEHLDLSESLDSVPREVLAETFGVATEAFPDLPKRGDRFLVRMGTAATSGSVGGNGRPDTPARPYTCNLEQLAPRVYEGGMINELTAAEIPHLEGITLFSLHAQPRGLREPHWHPNAAELNYCVQGRAQIGIVAPNGVRETFVVEPGDVAFIPQNYFHYIASTSDEPVHFLVFFSNISPNHIDLTESFDWFAHEVIAASFGVDQHVFAGIPRRGDVFMAAKKKFAGV
jgi:oxalate decarboxylase